MFLILIFLLSYLKCYLLLIFYAIWCQLSSQFYTKHYLLAAFLNKKHLFFGLERSKLVKYGLRLPISKKIVLLFINLKNK